MKLELTSKTLYTGNENVKTIYKYDFGCKESFKTSFIEFSTEHYDFYRKCKNTLENWILDGSEEITGMKVVKACLDDDVCIFYGRKINSTSWTPLKPIIKVFYNKDTKEIEFNKSIKYYKQTA